MKKGPTSRSNFLSPCETEPCLDPNCLPHHTRLILLVWVAKTTSETRIPILYRSPSYQFVLAVCCRYVEVVSFLYIRTLHFQSFVSQAIFEPPQIARSAMIIMPSNTSMVVYVYDYGTGWQPSWSQLQRQGSPWLTALIPFDFVVVIIPFGWDASLGDNSGHDDNHHDVMVGQC